jgi:hypothetical protein
MDLRGPAAIWQVADTNCNRAQTLDLQISLHS